MSENNYDLGIFKSTNDKPFFPIIPIETVINLDGESLPEILAEMSSGGDMLKSVYDTDNDGKVDSANDADTVNGHTVDADVPSDAEFTDTVYTHPITAGNIHIPSGGSTGKILSYGGSSGTAAWTDAPIDYAVASGTNTYTATITGYTLVEGRTVRIKFTNENTGASTLNINSLGAKSIVKGNGSAISSGNIKAGQICNLVYTGSVFQLLGEGGDIGELKPDFSFEDLSNFPISYVDIPVPTSNTTYTMPADKSWFLVGVVSSVDTKETGIGVRLRNKLEEIVLLLTSYANENSNKNIFEYGIIMSNFGGDYENNNLYINKNISLRLYYIDITILGIKSFGKGSDYTTTTITVPYDCLITGMVSFSTSTSSTETISLQSKIPSSWIIVDSASIRDGILLKKVLVPLKKDEEISVSKASSVTFAGGIWGRTFDNTKYTMLYVKEVDANSSPYNYILPSGYIYYAISTSIKGGATSSTYVNIANKEDTYPVTNHSSGYVTSQSIAILPSGTYITFSKIGSSNGWRISALRRAI